jgi:archaellum component FlaC
VSNPCAAISRLTEKCSGKYLKKLIGRTDIEDALKRLEKLTNEEVRMATAQVLKITHTVDDEVRVVGNKVLDVDSKVAVVGDRVAGVGDRVARVDDKVAGVDDRVARVDERVAGVDGHVKAIDDKVAVVIDGAQPSLISQQQNIFNPDVSRGKRDKGSHTTSSRRHGSSEKLVVFFLR